MVPLLIIVIIAIFALWIAFAWFVSQYDLHVEVTVTKKESRYN